MLSCHDLAHKYASDYIDHQLNWRERLSVKLHLMICSKCRRFVAQLRLVGKIVKQRLERDDFEAPYAGLHKVELDKKDLDNLSVRLHDEYSSQKKSSSDL